MISTEAPMSGEAGLVQDNAKMEESLTPKSHSFIYSSITTILTGLDYVFYIWTVLLIVLIAYLSIYKYLNTNKIKTTVNKSNSKNSNSLLNNIKIVVKILFSLVISFSKSIINFLLNKSPNSENKNKLNQKNFNQDSLLINNCLKWFYLNSETNKLINEKILLLLNSGNLKRSINSKYDDIWFKRVDTLPPKFSNIETVLSDSDTLTIKSHIEFKYLEIQAELKRSHRQLDIIIEKANAEALIVLGQSTSSSYILDCTVDPKSEISIQFKNDTKIEQSLCEFLKDILKNCVKNFVLSLELNFQNKKLYGTTKVNLQHFSPHTNISSKAHQSPLLNGKTRSSSPVEANSKLNTEPTNFNSESYNTNYLRNSVNEKRLLVKLLKANNLTNYEEPYCVVELDSPIQKHLTDVHKDVSSINEQFLFDITPSSEELSLYVYDRAKDYGKDLIGEAVLPVNDLCSENSGKRVIQLHRFGSQKTGSLTVEFLFIEPVNPIVELRNRSSIASRNSRSPHDRNERSSAEPMIGFNYRDDMKNDLKQTDNVSINSHNATKTDHLIYSPNTTKNITEYTASGNYSHSPMQVHESLVQSVNPVQSNSGRVINRNYMQIQPNLNSNTLQSNQLVSSIYLNESAKDGNSDDRNRTRSISRSVRNLFKPKSKKRDKSYDVQTGNQYDLNSDDTENLKKSKSIGGSLKKLFHIKKSSKKYEGSVHELRTGSPNPISITISRPSDANLQNSPNTRHLLTPIGSEKNYVNQGTYTINSNAHNENETVNLNESYERKEPLLLTRSLK